MTRFLLLSIIIAANVTPQCGSSSSSGGSNGGGNNVLPVVANAGPANNYINGLFTAVTVCVPGQSNCQTVNGVLVDTGSVGLRVLSSALTLSLPPQTAAGGGQVLECAQFQDGFTWGPIAMADVKLSGKQASGIPIQVIDESRFPIPQQCTSTGSSEDTLDSLGANGILGVGLFREDCGPACASLGASNPAFYFGCPSSGCVVIAQPNAQQLQNPVWLFSGDNNGIMIQLPSVPEAGTTAISGSLVFGIGTQSNNALGSARVLTTDAAGNFTTLYNGQSYTDSFIDSGSNGLFFLDAMTTGLPLCTSSKDFYCPAQTRSLSASQRGANGAVSSFQFSIGDADTVPNQFAVYGELGGPNAGSFNWGLPFFFGRTIFVAIEGQSAPGGIAPYWAY